MNTSVNLLNSPPVRILAVAITIIVTMAFRTPAALAKDGATDPAASTVNVAPAIYFQGDLITESGEAYPDGLYTIAFTFYDASAGGAQLWSETQTVYLEHGNFSVRLGEEKPMNLTFTTSRWLEVRPVDHDEIEPFRTEFLMPDQELDVR
jgi:hypothetical protein